MQDFRDGREPSSSLPHNFHSGPALSFERLEEVGDLHFHAAAYTSAVDYYRTALDASPADADAQSTLLRIRCKLADCFRVQGQLRRALEEFETASTEAAGLGTIETAATDVRIARVLQAQGRYSDAIDLATRSFTVLSLTDRHGDVAIAQMVLGIAHACRGQLVKAEEFFQDALSTYRRIGDEVSQAHVLNNLALLAKRNCRWTRALQLYERAEKLFHRHGANVEICALYLNKAVLLRKTGHRVESMASALQGLRLARTRGDQGGILRFDLILGQLKIDESAFAEAQDYLLEARVLAESEDSRRDLALADEFLGDLMFAKGELDDAMSNYDRAAERALELSPTNDILAEVSRRRAELHLRREEPELALEEVHRGVELVDASGEEFERGFLERTRGGALTLLDHVEEGLISYRESLDTFRRLHLDLEVFRTLLCLSEALVRRGGEKNLVVARARLNEALALELPPESGVRPGRAQFALARVELSLGNFDEALITLCDLERSAGDDDALHDAELSLLREEIEHAVSADARGGVESFHFVRDLSDRVAPNGRHDEATISSTLVTAAEQLGAQRAFVALRDERGRVRILANHEMALVHARALALRAWEQLSGQEPGHARVWSQAASDPAWIGGVAENRRPLDSVVGIRLFDAASGREGLFYFDAAVKDRIPFSPDSIAMASACVAMLGESILHRVPSDSLLDDEASPFSRFLTQSDRVREVLSLCAKVAPSPYTVLFTGETGTGKGLLARIIHDLSPRCDRSFVTVNCAAIPETLLESELFGHVRGAFTGADRDKDGLIVSAEGGTLFLDEIGKMPLPMQAKLLQFLDSREVRPVGSSQMRSVDVRVICASKRNLETMITTGEFLEDLYYRLLDFPVSIPPLRDRGDDIVLLAREFVARSCEDLGRPEPVLTRGFVSRLRAYDWPGNVRQMEKVMRRAVVLAASEERLREMHLPADLGPAAVDDSDGDPPEFRPLKEQVAELERSVLRRSLESTGWNRSETARRLKISYPTLLQKIRSYGLKENC